MAGTLADEALQVVELGPVVQTRQSLGCIIVVVAWTTERLRPPAEALLAELGAASAFFDCVVFGLVSAEGLNRLPPPGLGRVGEHADLIVEILK